MSTEYDLSITKPVTLWSRLMKDKQGIEFWEFNHLEDGRCEGDKPTPKHPSHSQVWNGKWQKEYAYMVDGEGWNGSPKVYHYL
jgi:hypothetical protein